MSARDYFWPAMSLPISVTMAYIPSVVEKLVIGRALGDYDNTQPRHNLEELEKLAGKSEDNDLKSSAHLAQRAHGAHINGLESLPIIIGGITLAFVTKVEPGV